MKNTIKLQLDSSALERLIGGDSEVEVEIRNSIAQAFAKRHLKGVIEEKYLEETKKEVCSSLWGFNLKNKEIPYLQVGDEFGNHRNCGVSSMILESIDSLIEKLLPLGGGSSLLV